MNVTERFEYVRHTWERQRDQVVEQWHTAHLSAMQCYQVEEIVAQLLFWFQRICHLDDVTQLHVLTSKTPLEIDFVQRMSYLYADWQAIVQKCVTLISTLEDDGYAVEGATELRECLRQANSILTPDDEFFSSDQLAALRDDAIDANRAGATEMMEI